MQWPAFQRGNNLAVNIGGEKWSLRAGRTIIRADNCLSFAPQPVVDGSPPSIWWTDGATPQSIQTSFFAATWIQLN